MIITPIIRRVRKPYETRRPRRALANRQESARAEFKIAALKDSGAWIIPTPADIGSTAQEMLRSKGFIS